MKTKKALYFLICCLLILGNASLHAQVKDSVIKKQDTGLKYNKNSVSNFNDSIKKMSSKDSSAIINSKKVTPSGDTLPGRIKAVTSLIINLENPSQVDSSAINTDNDSSKPDTTIPVKFQGNIIQKLLACNRLINTEDISIYHIEVERNPKGKEFLFYSLCIIVLILGIFKTFFSGYFNNLFRVFFNTSLRQTQLTDQLLQAKLPSLILNIFFTLTAGIYIWLLFTHFNPPRLISPRLLLPFCILSVAAIYIIKYCLLKFTGWVTDIQQTTDNYIFVIFLVNKIIGILLVPFIILLAFSMKEWVASITTISVLLLGLFFLSRYLKSYGFIEKKMPLNPFHFIIYIVGAEIIPLLILYKVAADYLV